MPARPRAGVLLALVLVGIAVPLAAAEPPTTPAVEPAKAVAAAPRRAIEPAAGTPSTAELPRVEIGPETRTVLARAPRRVLQVERPISVDKDLPLPLDLGASADLPMYVSGWVSIRAPETAETKGQFWEGSRLHLPIGPLWLDSPEEAGQAKAALQAPAPPDLPSRSGLLTVIAWPLGEAETRQTTAPFEVHRGDVLRFGYGVEDAAWAEGFAPVLFEVTAIRGDGTALHLFERRIDPVREPRDRRWFDAAISLDAVAGPGVRFAFTTTALPFEGGSLPRSLPVVSNPEVVPASPRPSDRPNLILISLDTLRAKSVGAYGNGRATTPALDRRVAAAGALIRRTVTPKPLTPPSHMTMLTGLEPCVHGVLERDNILSPDHATLAEILRAAGYRTGAVTEDAYVVAGAGFARGFDTYVEERSDEQSAPGFGAETFAIAERWLATRPAEPFFLFLHTYQVHAPYRPPRGYQGFFPEVVLADKPELDGMLRAYEQEVRYTDDLVAGFLDFLDVNGLSESTILVVTSDHGETFAESLVGGHGFNVKDSELLVPLLIRAPGIVPPGTVVEPQVGLVDLAPTLLDLLGVAAPVEMQGKSFASLLGRDGAPFPERPIVSSCDGTLSDSVRTRDWKYMKAGSANLTDRIYDLRSDPTERVDRAADRPDLLAEGRRLLEEHAERCRDWQEKHPAAKGVDPLFEHRPSWLVNRDEVAQKLRSLGYVE